MSMRDASREYRLDRRWFLFGSGAALAAFVPGSARAQGAKQAGSVENVTGDAFAEARAVRRALQPTAPVFIADQVRTGSGSRLTMQLGRDTKLRLGGDTRITIDRFLVDAGGEITLNSGPVLFERPEGSAPEPVRIRSTFGLIAVRGTVFFAGPSRGVFGVFVERGSVAVTAAGKQVVLQAGQGTDIARPGAPPTNPSAWGGPRIHDAMLSVS
jgi:ferric-dicitrate binding protein FerR (iron transport regulator)